ncbi:MAG TPA: serine--tRNA ligase [Candidatus Paceibacterota bacterium]
MLDIKFIRENLELVKEGARKKRIEVDVDRLMAVDDTRKELLASIEEKRALQNRFNDKMKGEGKVSKTHHFSDMRNIKSAIEQEEEKLKEVLKEWQMLMVQVPNIPDMSVPEGDDDGENREERTWGDKPKFSFEVKNHIELLQALDMVDFERGVKVAGFRGYFLKNDAVMLNFALWQFVLEHFKESGFTPMLVPSLLNRAAFLGTGYLPQGEEDLYKTQDGQYLAGTAEVATMSYYMDEILEQKQFPIKFLSFSPCFRREAGSHGKDTKGLIRVHEFYKFEQVVLCEASHEESVKQHEKLTENAEKLMQALELPYRVVVNCSGDLGLGQVKKYDLETWIPSEGKYRETHSSSYFHDFQTRRLNIRYRDGEGKTRFAHSLNNTALATPSRIMVALIENHQQEDGSIKVPKALQKYLGKEVLSK